MTHTTEPATNPELESARRVIAALRAYDDTNYPPGSMEDREALAVALRALDGHDAGYFFGFAAAPPGRGPQLATGNAPPTEAEARAIATARCDDSTPRPDGWIPSLAASFMESWPYSHGDQADLRILRAGVAIGKAIARARVGQASPPKPPPVCQPQPSPLDAQIDDLLKPQDLGEAGMVQLDPGYVRAVGVVLKGITTTTTDIPIPTLYATPEATIRAEWSFHQRGVVLEFRVDGGFVVDAFVVDTVPPFSVDEATFVMPHGRGFEPVVDWLRQWNTPAPVEPLP